MTKRPAKPTRSARARAAFPRPPEGSPIELVGGKLVTPSDPIVPFIEGDGTGPDIWKAAVRVLDRAVEKAFDGRRILVWYEIFAGDKAYQMFGDRLPEATLNAIRRHRVAIKGPLSTPAGAGYRSPNVAIRQALDLYACVRPIRHFQGGPTPIRDPSKVNFVIFRENTEDVYAGIEFKRGTRDARALIQFVEKRLGKNVASDSGLGIKPISTRGTMRLVRKALNFALQNKRHTLTLVHKGNIMKYTEGAFRDWGYQVALKEFADHVVTEEQVLQRHNGQVPPGKLLVRDRIADSMFQQVLLRPEEYDVIATTNLNGDYLSDACAAQVGGLGMVAEANLGDQAAVFGAVHGSAPKYAGLDRVNPTAVILSGVMMLEYLGWYEAASLAVRGLAKTIQSRAVTYDLARQMEDARELKCSEFAQEVVRNM